MADGESDLETDRLESELEALCGRHCTDESSLQSKEYCSGFCKLVEERTGRWQVPLPQLSVLRTALCCFTRATAAFPDGCQHVHYALSSLALSFFELMLFFSKEEFEEAPLKGIVDVFQECHDQLLRHRNRYLQQLKQVLKGGGPWENPVLQGILGQTALPHTQVEEYLRSEVPMFFELRVRYLQACGRLPEATALAKRCMEHPEKSRRLFFHQAYLTCLHKASLHQHLHKEMAELDGKDAVEILCTTESEERDDELLLSLCKAFLSQQLHNGDMYHLWDLVFLWSQLHRRVHPPTQDFLSECRTQDFLSECRTQDFLSECRTQDFLSECRQLVLSSTNVRVVFPFIKVITSELGGEGVQLGVELCARALQCDLRADPLALSLLCKTIAFLLPRDLEVSRACALLVFCQERSLEAYRTVCVLYTHPDQEPHQHLLRTSVRFHVLQVLKKGLRFDPEFWNLLTLRSHCVELLSDTALKAAVLSEMNMEREEEASCPESVAEVAEEGELKESPPELNGQEATVTKRKWKRRKRGRRKKRQESDDPDSGDDPEIKYFIKSPDSGPGQTKYELRRNPGAAHPQPLSPSSSSLPAHRQREYLSRQVKKQILKRRGRKRRWLQGLPGQEQAGGVRKRGRRPREGLQISFPENEVVLEQEEPSVPDEQGKSCLDQGNELRSGNKDSQVLEHKQEKELAQTVTVEEVNGSNELWEDYGLENHVDMQVDGSAGNGVRGVAGESGSDRAPEDRAAQGDPGLDGPDLMLQECPLEFFHNYCEKPDGFDDEESSWALKQEEEEEAVAMETSQEDIPEWKAKLLRARRYAHLRHHCSSCQKDFRGLNVMRHCLAHLKRATRCILCRKRFHQLPLAKKHVLQHIEEMLRCKKSAPDEAGATPAVNGTARPAQSDPSRGDEGKAPPADATATPKPKPRLARSKLLLFPREVRIIHNLRTLLRKSRNLQRRSEPRAAEPTDGEFTDEQVTIVGHMVFVTEKPAAGAQGDGGEGGAPEKRPGENGNGRSSEQRFYLCPSAECDRVFTCQGASLSKHVISSHLAEEVVQEKTFTWGKGKCPICCRMIQFLQHYKDHMKRHDDPLRYFCYHMECSDRFKTHQELKEHIRSHEPFRPRCSYPSCEQLFSGFQALYDHEWRHYTLARPEELEPGLKRRRGGGRCQPGSAEASWKQRVKIEEEWRHGGKGQRERTYVGDHSSSPAAAEVGEGPTRNGPDRAPRAPPLSESAAVGPGQPLSNGEHRDCRAAQTPSGGVVRPNAAASRQQSPAPDLLTRPRTATAQYFTPPRPSAPLRPKTYPTPPSLPQPTAAPTPTVPSSPDSPGPGRSSEEPLDVRDQEEHASLSEPPKLALVPEPVAPKPRDRPFVKGPYKRPSASTYLDESALSMRKRAEPVASPAKPWAFVKASGRSQPPAEAKVRPRCSKCLTFFGAAGELEEHRALNSCSSLFGFDDDDDDDSEFRWLPCFKSRSALPPSDARWSGVRGQPL
ncbi:zinc finger protein 654-like [Aplochiton taeniatus]